MQTLMSSGLREYVKRGWRSAVLAGVLGTGIRAGANLLLLPLVLDPRKLSKHELALWWIFLALEGFGNLADFGFGSTIPRIYSYLMAGAEDFEAEGLRPPKEAGPPNFAGISRLNATVRSLYLKLSLAAVGLLAIGGTLYLIDKVAASGLGGKIWWLWGFLVLAIGYNLATSHWSLAVQGLNRMRDLQVSFVMSGVSYVACAALLLTCHLGLASMVVAYFFAGWVLRWKCRRVYREVVPKPEKPAVSDPQIVRKLWPNTWKFGVLGVSGYCIANGNVLICGQFLSSDILDSFGLSAKLAGFMVGFAGLWLNVKWPEIAILRTQGRLEEMSRLFARRLALVMLSFIGMGLVLLFAGNALLEWKGSSTQLIPAPILAVYLACLAQRLLCLQFGSLAYTENVMPFFNVSLFTGLGVLACSLILTPLFGLWGLVAGPLIVEMAYCTWVVVRRGFRGQPLTPRQFALAAIGGRP